MQVHVERCFQIRKEERWLEMRGKIREEVERKNKPILLLLSSHNFGSEITDFSNICEFSLLYKRDKKNIFNFIFKRISDQY